MGESSRLCRQHIRQILFTKILPLMGRRRKADCPGVGKTSSHSFLKVVEWYPTWSSCYWTGLVEAYQLSPNTSSLCATAICASDVSLSLQKYDCLLFLWSNVNTILVLALGDIILQTLKDKFVIVILTNIFIVKNVNIWEEEMAFNKPTLYLVKTRVISRYYLQSGFSFRLITVNINI